MEALFTTDFRDLKLFSRGKVRDIYDLGNALLVVATDRISAFDVVLPTPIPDKGKILTQMSVFWFDFLKDLVPTHFVTANPREYPEELAPYLDVISGRSMLVKKAEVFPVECIVRGYITGSAMKEYREKGSVCGIRLPEGLREADRLPEPIFTPSTKASQGEHDVNITYEEFESIVGKDIAAVLKRYSLEIYSKASAYAEQRGIIIADTKFEFGRIDGEIVLVDEVLTPDSSRFWPKEEYEPGRPQKSFDKQFVRDWLKEVGWDRKPPAPELPEEIVTKTRERYLEALRRLTGKTL